MSKSENSQMYGQNAPFQIDGNFGATAGIVEMLIQSNADRVVLLLNCRLSARKSLQLAVKYRDEVVIVKCKAKEMKNIELKNGKLVVNS